MVDTEVYGIDTNCVTLARFILTQQKKIPMATGEFTTLTNSILTAVKGISSAVRKAGMTHLQGLVGRSNVQGEEVKKLDVLSNELMINMIRSSYTSCAMVSEEVPVVIEVEPQQQGKYIVVFDPLDGSSNIDCCDGPPSLQDILQPGTKMVSAGYALYGSATMVVLTVGSGVHGFTLDPGIGEFILTHPNIKIKPRGRIFSTNEGLSAFWDKAMTEYIASKKNCASPYVARYVGSMVADIHRTLLYGGIFLYPATSRSPHGKLRLLYECFPMAMVIEKAGGLATTGTKNILDIEPESIHQRSSIILGSKEDVQEYMSFVKKYQTEH
ncbi:unnamed protein product [Soboliphyme baturini]|uniref:fructose-bisphosphatase n=1 Tax=Soboliphyme baturini TaxID=241478 RepID=A0A183IL92_9BILA|nr:unnamed protein product [Soboliphyme baturini]